MIMGHEDPDSKEFVHILVKDYLRFALEGSQSAPASNTVAETLRRSGSFLQRYEQKFKKYICRLNVGSIEEAKRAFPILMSEIYSDGTDNWGRLVTLYAFCGVLVRHLKSKGIPEEELIEDIAQCVAQHTWTHKAAWIKENGGWEKGFVEYFRQKSPRFSYAKIAAITGIVAACSFVIYQN
ncbi:bcl-2-related protein A1-like [Heterodontus francisci]|uniref:bcl-2-related protein A1-like n=1 Tax=Heterodontus francisci TaxID=7792 RepID=UPI00355BA716